MTPDFSRRLGLAAIRYSVAAFFAVWAIEKFVKPDVTGRIWSHFYKIEGIGTYASYGIGAFQLAIIGLFALGLFRTWTYGALFLMHAVSTLSTWEHLIDPYGKNHLFWAGVPTLAAMAALWLMRKDDSLATLGN